MNHHIQHRVLAQPKPVWVDGKGFASRPWPGWLLQWDRDALKAWTGVVAMTNPNGYWFLELHVPAEQIRPREVVNDEEAPVLAP